MLTFCVMFWVLEFEVKMIDVAIVVDVFTALSLPKESDDHEQV